MFVLLSRVLLWLLIGTIAVTVFQKIYPQSNYVVRFIVIFLLAILTLAFFIPNEPAVQSLWNVISFPLKPLGASILLLVMAAQSMKDGAIGKPGGSFLTAALTILLLSSTPAVAYFLIRSPIAMVGNDAIATQETLENIQLSSSPSPTLLAFNPSDAAGDTILYTTGISDVTVTPYLMQTPEAIARRGLRLEDFVPSAQTLSLTTRVWESYLNQIYIFLRPRR
ncbi:MAG: hypothetical protein QNJ47_15075 [Nostocaceae cyanobacterium]|nr:hypothetical protein [Nostocaceae cyanobacterium]